MATRTKGTRSTREAKTASTKTNHDSENRRRAAGKKRTVRKKAAKPRTPRTRKPEGMSLDEWQVALRREFGELQSFRMKNVGDEPIFSEFIVENPESGGRYRIAIRGEAPGMNYCSCPDFVVNTVGTCKHIEFGLSRLRKKRGARKAFREGFRPPYAEVYLRYGAKREVVFSAGLECPDKLVSLAGKYFDDDHRLKPDCYSQFDAFLKKSAKIDHELRCYDDAIGFVAQVRDRDRLRQAVDKAFAGTRRSAAWRKLLKIELYGYQKTGAVFAARTGRAIIADDMGLGKTIQAMAAAEILAKVAKIGRVLVVCPASLKHQWQSEIEKFTGRSSQVVQGGRETRGALYREESFYKIVNYELVHRDRDRIAEWAPDLIVLDEAQRIKNWQTRTAQSVKQLESPYAIVLTGTPLQNRLEELHSIVEFVDRFHLGPRFRFLYEHQLTDESGMIVGYRQLNKVAETLAPILIRRTKKEVLKELPERLEKKYFVPMTPQQRQYHEDNETIVSRIVAKWRRNRFIAEADQRRLMVALQCMRMSCNSTYLLDKETDYGCKVDELMSLLQDTFEDPNAKVVIFSQWVGTHELIIRRVQAAGWDYAFLHGRVPSPQRKNLVRRFREDRSCRIFLATEAGGVGMNLQHASAVVNMDLPWNPAVLEQRIGRVHRLGQQRPVQVVNFISSNTIEHGMLSRLSFKQSLFAGVLDGGRDEVFLGGPRLQRFMQSVEETVGATPTKADAESTPTTEVPAETQAIQPYRAAEPPSGSSDAASMQEAWSQVASAGLEFLNKLGQALAAPQQSTKKTSSAEQALPRIERDDAGRGFVRLPLPETDTLKKLADLLTEVSGHLQ